jgi:hypothetical protein
MNLYNLENPKKCTNSKWPFILSWYVKIDFLVVANSSPTFMYSWQVLVDHAFNGHFMDGWKSFKVYQTWQKGPSPYYSPFLSYILILIKNNESKVVKFSKGLYFKPLQF